MELSKELDEIDTELQEIETQIESLLERQQFLQSRKELIQSQICSHLDSSETTISSSSKKKESNKDWSGKDFPWSQNVETAREDIFNIKTFRPLQLECINATMSGSDCILIMPTGGGKSLCFQLPAVISKGITLVVSPLISLIEDQLMALKELKIDSTFLNANCSKGEVNAVHHAMVDKKSDLKLLYVTPEKIAKSKRFMAKLEKTYEGTVHIFMLKLVLRLAAIVYVVASIRPVLKTAVVLATSCFREGRSSWLTGWGKKKQNYSMDCQICIRIPL